MTNTEGESCRNPNHRGAWEVTAYRRTSSGPIKDSDYSEVICNRCMRVWRTKAGYVEELPRRSKA